MAGYRAIVKAIRHKDQSKVRYKLVNYRQIGTRYDTNGTPTTTIDKAYRRLYNVASR